MIELPEKYIESLTINSRGETIAISKHRVIPYQVELRNGITLEMIKIPGGIYSMGSSPWIGNEDERPQHIVTVSQFFLSIFPITQEQWTSVMKKSVPCRFNGLKLPVENVSWDDALAFCNRLGIITGLRFRLPSEAEWEYACRAGTTTPFHFGETITTDLANYVGEYIYIQEPQGIYRHKTTEVGAFPPNPYGVYDMHGNIWEWCADEWHANYVGAPADSIAWESHHHVDNRVLRGGSWHEIPANCRSTTRLQLIHSYKDDYIGFRVAL
jgi:eukaryotic-like serine/threonine-protein kinase